ncbi:hypothetical protein CYMTET_38304 [Cymbomonas tetramitiformis]|uniref:Uncharacterized protein n=1 Tax=Cymbomonas tetramitiformis TaxID=36881 RepID=A0AAE0CE08_9CHLO|nr:hypothetical protein CYMTET_38304 [Cymbomonas tetramitiformis]
MACSDIVDAIVVGKADLICCGGASDAMLLNVNHSVLNAVDPARDSCVGECMGLAESHALEGHDGLTAASFTPCGDWLVTARLDGRMSLWHALSLRLSRSVSFGSGRQADGEALQGSLHEGRPVVPGQSESSLEGLIEGFDCGQRVVSLALMYGDKETEELYAFVALADSITASLWHLGLEEMVMELRPAEGVTEAVGAARVLPKAGQNPTGLFCLFVGSVQGVLAADVKELVGWSPAEGSPPVVAKQELLEVVGGVYSIAVEEREGGEVLMAAGGPGGKMLLWRRSAEVVEPSTWELLHSFSPGWCINHIMLGCSARRLACGGCDGVTGLVEVWNTETGEREVAYSPRLQRVCSLQTSTVNAVAFLPGDQFIVSGGYDSALSVWLLPALQKMPALAL